VFFRLFIFIIISLPAKKNYELTGKNIILPITVQVILFENRFLIQQLYFTLKFLHSNFIKAFAFFDATNSTAQECDATGV